MMQSFSFSLNDFILIAIYGIISWSTPQPKFNFCIFLHRVLYEGSGNFCFNKNLYPFQPTANRIYNAFLILSANQRVIFFLHKRDSTWSSERNGIFFNMFWHDLNYLFLSLDFFCSIQTLFCRRRFFFLGCLKLWNITISRQVSIQRGKQTFLGQVHLLQSCPQNLVSVSS